MSGCCKCPISAKRNLNTEANVVVSKCTVANVTVYSYLLNSRLLHYFTLISGDV